MGVAKRKNLNGPVERTGPHPLVEEIALFLADGDRNRWRILSRTVIIVDNQPSQKRTYQWVMAAKRDHEDIYIEGN